MVIFTGANRGVQALMLCCKRSDLRKEATIPGSEIYPCKQDSDKEDNSTIESVQRQPRPDHFEIELNWLAVLLPSTKGRHIVQMQSPNSGYF